MEVKVILVVTYLVNDQGPDVPFLLTTWHHLCPLKQLEEAARETDLIKIKTLKIENLKSKLGLIIEEEPDLSCTSELWTKIPNNFISFPPK